MDNGHPGLYLRDTRRRANLSQRALARRAGTAQSVIARIETGETSPTWDTLVRLFDHLGFTVDLRLDLRPSPLTHMLDDATRILRLTPEARLTELRNVAAFLGGARRV